MKEPPAYNPHVKESCLAGDQKVKFYFGFTQTGEKFGSTCDFDETSRDIKDYFIFLESL